VFDQAPDDQDFEHLVPVHLVTCDTVATRIPACGTSVPWPSRAGNRLPVDGGFAGLICRWIHARLLLTSRSTPRVTSARNVGTRTRFLPLEHRTPGRQSRTRPDGTPRRCATPVITHSSSREGAWKEPHPPLNVSLALLSSRWSDPVSLEAIGPKAITSLPRCCRRVKGIPFRPGGFLRWTARTTTRRRVRSVKEGERAPV
jgi:hypothetical protein